MLTMDSLKRQKNDPAKIYAKAAASMFKVLEEICEGAIAVDITGHIVWMNEKYQSILQVEDLDAALGEDIEKIIPNSLMHQVIATGRPILLDIMEFGNRSLVVTPAKNVFYCFNAQEGGDVIALYAHAEGLNVRDAAAALEELYCTSTGTSNSQPVPERREAKETQKLQPLSYLDAEHEAVLAVGFDPIDAELLGIGYAKKGIMRGTVAVPVRLEDGSLVGYIGVTEATLPPSFNLQSNVVPLRKNTA